MESLLWLLLPVVALAGVIGLIFVGYSDVIGTKAQRRRRHEEMVRSFDGRPEVKVRVSGTGLSPVQTAWLARQYGYGVQRWETDRHKPRYLVVRRIDQSPPPAGPGFGPPPPPFSGPVPSPADHSADQLRAELRRAPDPVARRNQFMALLVLGAGAAVGAVSNYRSGGPYVLPAVAAVVLLAGATVLRWYSRRAARHPHTSPPSDRRKQ
ncbi:hypothetical protein ACIBK8_00510 [Streptomyces sp. NPDC050161]|uniref:hypothetical protein n=1 Tax=Streptomyces sp. NPDC050161 TaxID=3365604 RepID=UPI0037A511A7